MVAVELSRLEGSRTTVVEDEDPTRPVLARIVRIYGKGPNTMYAMRDSVRLIKSELEYCKNHPELCQDPEEHRGYIDRYNDLIRASQENGWVAIKLAISAYALGMIESREKQTRELGTAVFNLAMSIQP